jgi:hypothetical protein
LRARQRLNWQPEFYFLHPKGHFIMTKTTDRNAIAVKLRAAHRAAQLNNYMFLQASFLLEDVVAAYVEEDTHALIVAVAEAQELLHDALGIEPTEVIHVCEKCVDKSRARMSAAAKAKMN